MIIEKIFLKDFRNFSELNLSPKNEINIFLGKNAQGKTNILEAIYFSSLGKSRAAKDSELIRHEKNSAIVRIKFFKAEISHELAMEISAEKRKKILLDGNSIQFKNLIGKLNSVMFSPEDIFMFKNSPSVRRKFLDGEISQASPIYFANLSNFNRLADQRNNLLKKIREGLASPANLDLWSEQFSVAAAKIILKRLQAIDKLNFLANLMQRKISAQSENLSVIYDFHGLEESNKNFLKKSGINFDTPQKFNENLTEKFFADFYHEILKSRKFSDINRGSTSLGPHLDDLKFFVNGRELKIFGSQGQLRTAALALKLSELQFLKSETGEYPILLLDDVMSELDFDRREKLLNFLRREKIQTFITATEKEYFPQKNFGKYFFVKNGEIEGEKNE